MDSLSGTPNTASNQLDGGEKVERILVVSSGDSSELLEPVEESFDQIALPIDPGGKDEGSLAIGARRNVGPCLLFHRQGADGIAVIAFVGQQNGTVVHGLQQTSGFKAVVDLPAGQAQGNGATFRIDERMDFAGKAPTGTSHAAIVKTPFFPVAPCW